MSLPEPDPIAPVIPLERPPIRQAVVVRQRIDRTFTTFTRRIAEWWPLTPFSIGQDRIAAVTFEEHVGGRVYETWHDGTVRDWGRVLAWSPPELFAMSWNITGEPTDVEVRFVAEDEATTRVELEHRGWDRLSEAQLTTDCALPGGYRGGAFDRGWTRILSAFRDAVDARTDPQDPGPGGRTDGER